MISEYIPVGYNNRITREELGRRTGHSDRRIRDEIQYENEHGKELIINIDDAYFIPDTVSDLSYIDTYLIREYSRVKAIAKKLRAMQKKRNEAHPDGQISLEEWLENEG